MKAYILALIHSIIVATTNCSLQAQTPGDKPAADNLKAVAMLPDWTKETKLPLLRATIIRPKRDGDSFTCLPHEVRFSDARKHSGSETQFFTDAEAEAAALGWITANFGALPEGVSLRSSKILHSASGNPAPKYDWDKGHTVVFQEFYNSIPTIGSASIYITGKIVIKASLCLYQYKPENSLREVLTPQRATKAFRKAIAGKSLGISGRESSEIPKPKLEYDRDPHDNRDLTLQYDVLTPTWIMDADGILKVNAFSGRFWVDD